MRSVCAVQKHRKIRLNVSLGQILQSCKLLKYGIFLLGHKIHTYLNVYYAVMDSYIF